MILGAIELALLIVSMGFAGMVGRGARKLHRTRKEGFYIPAKWQQWMPFRIDAFKGSPAVQAMHPCARIGYLYLLSCAWQTEDCTVPNDPLELAEKSGLGDELWAIHGPRIVRKFEPVNGNGRLRNQVCYDDWVEAKRVFEARRKAADRTNSLRSPSQDPTVTVGEPSRSADTRTTVVPVDVFVTVPVSVSEDTETETPLDSSMFASAVLTECRIGGRNLRMVLEEVGNAEQSHGENLEVLAAWAVRSWNEYCAVKSQLKYPWGAEKFFGEGHWKHPENWPRKDSDVYANFSLGLSDETE